MFVIQTDQYVWAAARATSAAPFYFKQHEHYADGGLKANNPSMSGLTTIHEYYTNNGIWNYKILVVASLGCGKFYKAMGPIDAELRQHIPNAAQLGDIPNHLRHLRVITAIKAAKQGYDAINNLGTPAKGFLFDVLLAEVCINYFDLIATLAYIASRVGRRLFKCHKKISLAYVRYSLEIHWL